MHRLANVYCGIYGNRLAVRGRRSPLAAAPAGDERRGRRGVEPARLRTAWRRFARACRRLLLRWRRYRDARATYFALRELDPYLLRDLGLHCSEHTSVAADLSGIAEPTRVRVVQSLHGLR